MCLCHFSFLIHMTELDAEMTEDFLGFRSTMGLFGKSIFVLAVAIAVAFFISNRYQAPPPVIGGNVQTGFESVGKAFRQNFEKGLESGGAAFAVCHRGKLVVDLWGGYADKMALRPWKQDTMTTAFSTTKAVAALVIAMLVDRGHIAYEDLVTKHWPEFGAHGKDNVTVKMLVSHQAGLAALDERVTWEILRDWRKMSKAFESQVPNWPPGTDNGYHALTFGWLCDQLVRRVDPQHRSLGKFFQEEVSKKFDIDFFIGLPRDQLYRVARMTTPSLWDQLVRIGSDWTVAMIIVLQTLFFNPNPLMTKVMNNPNWLDTRGGYFQFNNPDIHELEVPGANGIGTARGLAKLFCLLDGTELLSKKTLNKVSQPVVVDHMDRVIGINLTSGWGFMFTKSPENHYQLGHMGYGGQNAKFDAQEHLAFAYLRSNMASDMGDMSITLRNLQNAVYESVKSLKNKH